MTLHKVAGGTLHIRFKKNDGSSQKSVVRQLKQMGLCLPSKRQQRRGGPDLCWQNIVDILCQISRALFFISSVYDVLKWLLFLQKFQKINLAYKRLITDNENVSMTKVSKSCGPLLRLISYNVDYNNNAEKPNVVEGRFLQHVHASPI